MKPSLCLVAALLVATAASAQVQTEYPVHTPVILEWVAWTPLELADHKVTNVTLEFDGALMTGVPPVFPVPASGLYEYVVPPHLLVIGPHQARAQVCRDDGVCGGWTSVTVLVVPLLPGLLKDFKARPPAEDAATPIQAVEMGNCYYDTFQGMGKLTDQQLIALATRYLEKHPDRVLLRSRLLELFESEKTSK